MTMIAFTQSAHWAALGLYALALAAGVVGRAG